MAIRQTRRSKGFLMVNTEVSYEAPFDVNDNFDAVFSKFIENQAKD